MKALTTILLFSCITMISCKRSTSPVSGTYVMSFKNEYSIATDTIVIREFNRDAETYEIERRDGFNRIRNGKVLPKEFKRQSWIATYDSEKKVLQETAYGRQVYLKNDGQSLSFGGTYQKIK